ncbi:MAG TPA: CopG family transcriptional regulator, partial [Microbacterium sp.]|nr:CopG family transcriptional regulator [Microbacterium sp.]
MRTTLNLPDGLVEAAKQRARERGVTLTDFIRDAMARSLHEQPDHVPAPMPTFGGSEGRGLRI